jgi:WD40 repeat protein
MKKILLILLASVLFAITPQKITFDGYISKVAFNNKYLVSGLENGDVVIKDFNSLKNIYVIHLPKIEDFMGDKIAMPIYSLDIYKDELLILAGGEDSKREFFMFDIKTKKLNHIFTSKDTFMKAKFIKDKVFFAYLSDEISLYDIKTQKFIYKTQIGHYVFSTFALNSDKSIAAIGDESGILKIVNTKNGKLIAKLKGFNKDQTLSVDIYKNLVINGSSDKRVAIYNINTKNSMLELQAKFLPYGASINNNKFAIQFDEKNNIALYDFNKDMKLLKGHTMPLNGMKFINANELLSYSPAEIIIWKLK